MKKPVFQVKRAVWGFESGPTNGTPHLQGYLELLRTHRLSHVRKIFPEARWEPANQTSHINYNYCTKSGHFQTYGDFSVEKQTKTPVQASMTLILKGLMIPKLVPQIKMSAEYTEKHSFYDKTIKYLRQIRREWDFFTLWSTKTLYHWQYHVLSMTLNQPQRNVLWIADPDGNSGKTYLATFLNILYGFMLMNGGIHMRDLGHMISDTEELKGFVIDVSRSGMKNFDYGALEHLKNGYLSTGKYGGRCLRFKVVPVVVFSNEAPDLMQLSLDRWSFHTIGKGELSNMSKAVSISPSVDFPFHEPSVKFPILDDCFDLKAHILTNLPSEEDHAIVVDPSNSAVNANIINDSIVQSNTPLQQCSQTPGPSRNITVAVRGKVCEKHPNQGKMTG